MMGCPATFDLLDAENLYGLGVVMGGGAVGLLWLLLGRVARRPNGDSSDPGA